MTRPSRLHRPCLHRCRRHRSRPVAVLLLVALTAATLGLASPVRADAAPAAPPSPAALIGVGTATKIVSVVSDSWSDTTATLSLWKLSPTGFWAEVGRPWTVWVGAGGFAPPGQKAEGDRRSPTGSFTFGAGFGQGTNPGYQGPWVTITGNMWWDSTSGSPGYNTLQYAPPYRPTSADEKIDTTDPNPQIFINYNVDPAVPGAGSAIFLHAQPAPHTVTDGCVGVPDPAVLLQIVRFIDPATRIIMGPSSAVTHPVAIDPSRVPAYVTSVYSAMLGRAPDAGGLGYWTGRLNSGVAPTAFAATFTNSAEARSREVTAAYQHALGRVPDPDGRVYWVGQLQRGEPFVDVLGELYGSAEWASHAGPGADAYVRALYLALLGRSPETRGLAYWTDAIEHGTPRAVMAAALLATPEAAMKVVDVEYATVFGRAPDPSGLAYWTGWLQTHGLDPLGLRARLLATPEGIARGSSGKR